MPHLATSLLLLAASIHGGEAAVATNALFSDNMYETPFGAISESHAAAG